MLKGLAFAAAAMVAFPVHAGITVLEYSAPFDIRTSNALRESTLFDPIYRTGGSGGDDMAASGFYTGTVTYANNPVSIALPGFDPRMGMLTAAVVTIASERAVSVTNITVPPRGANSAFDQMQYTARATFVANLGSQVINAGNASRSATCVTAVAPNQICTIAATDHAAFTGAASFDPALFQAGEIAIGLQHMQAIDWDGYAFFRRGVEVGVGNGFQWFGTVGVRYEFTPFAAAVPEPGTWALLILGFGAIGGAMRRHRLPKRLVTA